MGKKLMIMSPRQWRDGGALTWVCEFCGHENTLDALKRAVHCEECSMRYMVTVQVYLPGREIEEEE